MFFNGLTCVLRTHDIIKSNKWNVVIKDNDIHPYVQFESQSDLLKYTILHLFSVKRLDLDKYLLLPLTESTINLIKYDISTIFNYLIEYKELDSMLEIVFNNLNTQTQKQLIELG